MQPRNPSCGADGGVRHPEAPTGTHRHPRRANVTRSPGPYPHRVSSQQLAIDAASTVTACMAVAVAAVVVSDVVARWLPLPTVVLEILGGILVGPDVLELADDNVIVSALSELGLLLLLFLAGYEVQLERIKGPPLRSAVVGWTTSLVIGLAAGIVLVEVARPESSWTAGALIGLIFTTTALGTILPILRDSGELDTVFGTFILSAGAVGEFGPILAIALLLSGQSVVHTLAVLAVFAVVAALVFRRAAMERSARVSRLLERTLGTSGQLGVRVAMLVVLLLSWVAAELGLDVLLGAFAAGLVVRLFLSGQPEEVQEGTMIRVEGAGFGFLVPVFFVVSGIRFDLDGLLGDPGALVLVPIALALFLLIRGGPTYAALRGQLAGRARIGAAVYTATALPLVVVITSIGVEDDHLTETTAAALVAAGIVSVLLFPLSATRLRGIRQAATPQGWRDDSDGL